MGHGCAGGMMFVSRVGCNNEWGVVMPWAWSVVGRGSGCGRLQKQLGKNCLDLIAPGEPEASDQAVGRHEGSRKTGRPAGR